MTNKKHSKITLAVHHDADGIAAAVLLCKGLKLKPKDVILHFPESFGDVTDEDYVCDMCPTNPTYKGTVYDHHPGHPSKKNRDYKLIFDNVPAGVIVFNHFKKTIPKKDWWKCIVGDTKIKTINGNKNISELSIHDTILSYDIINNKIVHIKSPIVTNNGYSKIMTIKTEHGNVIKCTPDHKLFINNFEIVNARELKCGDNLVLIK